MQKFVDYDAKKIAAKLKQCREFEEKFGECDTSGFGEMLYDNPVKY